LFSGVDEVRSFLQIPSLGVVPVITMSSDERRRKRNRIIIIITAALLLAAAVAALFVVEPLREAVQKVTEALPL
jgi:hypothetical protein